MGNLFSKVLLKTAESPLPAIRCDVSCQTDIELKIDLNESSPPTVSGSPISIAVEGDPDKSTVGTSKKHPTCSTCRKRFTKSKLRLSASGQMVCRSCWSSTCKRSTKVSGDPDTSTDECSETNKSTNEQGKDDCANGECNYESLQSPPAKKSKISLRINRSNVNVRCCVFCVSKRQQKYGCDKLVRIPRKARVTVFIQKGFLIPSDARCCQKHIVDGYIESDAVDSCTLLSSSCSMTAGELEKLLKSLRTAALKKGLDFDSKDALSDEDYFVLTGLRQHQFDELLRSILESVRNTYNRSRRTCLAILLMKLRTGLSHSILSSLFALPKSTIGKTIAMMRQILMKSFVPDHLGVNHISREQVIAHHTNPVAKEIFSPHSDQVILVADATYIYIQKSSNYSFQRKTYSIHKGRPLVKPMIIVTSDGYFLDIFGPYLADGKNNDAGIMTAIMKAQQSRLRAWLKEGDTFIVDRGFRDCLGMLQSLGMQTEMPSFLQKGSQHTTQEANDSRLVTAVRWVVESANGLLKTWLILNHVLPNTQIPFVGDYVRIVCALCNAYRPPRISPSYDNVVRAQRMLQLSKLPNKLQSRVEDNKWDKKRVIYDHEDISMFKGDEVLPDFPALSYEELQDLTLGVYQIKQARSYTAEHLNPEGLYSISYLKEEQNIIRVLIQSRHTSSKQYSLWIQYTSGQSPSFEWYCKCKVGARVVGCCAHVASVLWYLGYWRHQGQGALQVNEASALAIEDADAVGWSESSDEDSLTDNDSDC